MPRFQGFFKEAVVESALENFRVRKVVIFYYLEDNSVSITEPKLENSGIPQWGFLKRQKVREYETLLIIQGFEVRRKRALLSARGLRCWLGH